MIICSYCYEELKSRGEKFKTLRQIFPTVWDDEDENPDSQCEMCEEYGNDELTEIEFI